MSRDLTISPTGLKLIKAYEGYRPVDRELVTGSRVVGYGHRVHTPGAVTMNRAEAEDQLRLDLAAYEDMINSEVHAPISQSQFDALCSLAFNIGPKAFRGSDTLRALNNGRPLDAANGFDVWRKANIDGRTYVVDALMRRRTAEKALFLRTEKSLPAGAGLEPEPDEVAALVPTDDGLPVFSAKDADAVIAKAPYDARPNPMRRRDDDPAGILTLSEVIEPGDAAAFDAVPVDIEIPDDAEVDPAVAGLTEIETELAANLNAPEKPSPIAEAADALSQRLDALIDDVENGPSPADEADWPQSLIKAATPATDENGVAMDAIDAGADDEILNPDAVEASNLLQFPGRKTDISEAPDEARSAEDSVGTLRVIDELSADEMIRDGREAALGRPSTKAPDIPPQFDLPEETRDSAAGLWIPILLGFALLGASGMAWWLGAKALMGEWGPLLAIAGMITGGLMVLAALYAALRRTI